MSASYQSVLWNRQKKIYDGIIAVMVVVYLTGFTLLGVVFYPEVTQETLIIRSTGTLSILLLHSILMIGPLARLNTIFLPLLYNRRHLGVTMFCLSAIHGIFSVIQFHALGDTNLVLSVFVSNTHYNSLTRFPFQVFGFFALIIFTLLAITSHDFWLHNLGPRFWKTLHMLVYAAYSFIVLHVLVGVLQYETSPALTVPFGAGLSVVVLLHLLAGHRERKIDRQKIFHQLNEFIKVCELRDIKDNCAKVISLGHERIAVFKYGNKVSAVSNVCKHQNGPLGEGRIIDGCITCPWHGYQYHPHNGSSPPPFKEKVATYDVQVIGTEVWISPKPYPDGTARPPAIIKF